MYNIFRKSLILKLSKLIFHIITPKLWKSTLNGVFLSLEHRQVLRQLNKLGIKVIYDIGANRGQFALASNLFFRNSYIYSFEPVFSSYKKLSKIFSNSKCIKCFNIALGQKEKQIYINHTSSYDNASILEPNKILTTTFGIKNIKSREKVNIFSLDYVIKNEKLLLSNSLLKIDVQGFELEVLKGCSENLKNFNYIYIEISHVEFYNNQPIGNEIIEFLSCFGFYILLTDNHIFSPNGKLLQADYLFTNKKY